MPTARMDFLENCLKNSLTAGATAIKIDFDAGENSLAISDNGGGIQDFDKFLNVTQAVKRGSLMPHEADFRDGLFAAYEAAHRVYVDSAGKTATICLDGHNIIESRAVRSDLAPAGCVIELCGLNKSLSEKIATPNKYPPTFTTVLEQHLEQLVVGFPIPVFFNGRALERPYAVDALQCVETEIGLVSCPFVNGQIVKLGALHKLFLNGLQVDRFNRCGHADSAVVHLDPKAGKSIMQGTPPGSRYGRLQEIDECIKKLRVSHLAALKQKLTHHEFAECYTDNCFDLEVPELLNDVYFVPFTSLGKVQSVRADRSDVLELAVIDPQLPAGFHRLQFVNGDVTVWHGVPEETQAQGLSVIMLQMAMALDVVLVKKNYHPEHWIYSVGHKVKDLEFSFLTSDVKSTSHDVSLNYPYTSASIRSTNQITAYVRGINGSDYAENCDNLPWLAVPSQMLEGKWMCDSPLSIGLNCYVSHLDSPEVLASALACVENDYGDVNDAELEKLTALFSDAIDIANGASFEELLGRGLPRMKIDFTHCPTDSMCVVVPGTYHASVLCDLTNAAFWKTLAAAPGCNPLGLPIEHHAATLKEGFLSAAEVHKGIGH